MVVAKGKDLGIIGEEDSTDPTTSKPELVVSKVPSGWQFSFNLQGFFDGIKLYRKRPEEDKFSFIAMFYMFKGLKIVFGGSIALYEAFIAVNERSIGANERSIGYNRRSIGYNRRSIGANERSIGFNSRSIYANGTAIDANSHSIGVLEKI